MVRARVRGIAFGVWLAWALTCGAAEPPAPIYLTEAVPEGFTREPKCKEHTICVSPSLFMLEADFLAIRDLALGEIPKDGWEITEIRDVMPGVVVVTARTRDHGWSWGAGTRLLVEHTQKGWSVLRKQHWVV